MSQNLIKTHYTDKSVCMVVIFLIIWKTPQHDKSQISHICSEM